MEKFYRKLFRNGLIKSLHLMIPKNCICEQPVIRIAFYLSIFIHLIPFSSFHSYFIAPEDLDDESAANRLRKARIYPNMAQFQWQSIYWINIMWHSGFSHVLYERRALSVHCNLVKSDDLRSFYILDFGLAFETLISF